MSKRICGYCLTSFKVEQIGDHGAEANQCGRIWTGARERAGMQLFDLWEETTGQDKGGWFQDLREELAERLFKSYQDLLDKDEMDEKDEERMMRMEGGAERQMVTDFLKRLRIVYDIPLKDLET